MNFSSDLNESTRSDRRGWDMVGWDNNISQDSKGLSDEYCLNFITLIEPDKI